MSIKAELINAELNSGWELLDNKRKTFEYTGSNLTTINLEIFKNGEWVKIFKQELTYDGLDNLLTVTGTKI